VPRGHGFCASVVLAFLAAMAGFVANAATVRRMSLDALVDSSDVIFHGRVIQCRSQWDPATGAIWTRTELRVLDATKGRAGTSIAVTEPGGIVGSRGELYPGVPHFKIGQEVVLFLYRAPGNRLRVTGLLQGVYTVCNDPQTGERMAVPAVPAAEVVFEGARPAQADPAATVVRESLSRFLYGIRLRAASR
jgi:hypothetical protein